MSITAFISEKFIFTVETKQCRKKVFQIIFQRKDGSILIPLPYYKETEGLLTLVTIRGNTSFPTTVPLKVGGKVTGHKVKYTHHTDGNVHFSQDKKIYTKVRKKSVPLSKAEGHIFTVQLQGLHDFKDLRENEKKPLLSDKKTILNFKFESDDIPEAIKFVGHWYKESEFEKRIQAHGTKPWFIAEKPDKSTVLGIMIKSPHIVNNEQYFLLVTCESTPLLSKDHESTLMFLAGFDPPEISLDHTKDTQYLALAYPASEAYNKLVKEIGTVDYTKPKSSNE